MLTSVTLAHKGCISGIGDHVVFQNPLRAMASSLERIARLTALFPIFPIKLKHGILATSEKTNAINSVERSRIPIGSRFGFSGSVEACGAAQVTQAREESVNKAY